MRLWKIEFKVVEGGAYTSSQFDVFIFLFAL